MRCFGPLEAWHSPGAPLAWSSAAEARGFRRIEIRCGQCIGCRLNRSKNWAIRCMHESACHAYSSFITLTYSDDSLPVDRSLRYSDFQLFMKRLRALVSYERQRVTPSGSLLFGDTVRFFMCGEYGENTFRPHYHACIFGVHFADRVLFKRMASGFNIYTSDVLKCLWPEGHCSIGDVTFESAAYVARYCVKKVTGDAAESHYRRYDPHTGEVFQLLPEFTHMSLKPGIGAFFFDKYKGEIYPHDEVIVRGMKLRPPKYYDTLFANADPVSFEVIQHERYKKSLLMADDATPQRLRDGEIVARARLAFKRRTLE